MTPLDKARETQAREYISWTPERREYHIHKLTTGKGGRTAALRFLDDVAQLRRKERT
jgi:hypothetical protein